MNVDAHPKGGISKMNPMNKAWFVLKGSRDKIAADEYDRGRKNRRQVPTKGGSEEDWGYYTDKSGSYDSGVDQEENYGEIPEDTSDTDNLASATREDLINMVTEQVNQMSNEDLLNLLRSTEGELIDTLGEPNMPPPSTIRPYQPEIRDERGE